MVSDSGPVTRQALYEGEERLLEAAQAAFPGWAITRVFGGWQAVPDGVIVITAVDIDGIVEKLRGLNDRQG